MAMLDYGAIVFENNKLKTKDFFTDMKEAVGWEDSEKMIDQNKEPLNLKDKYFTYIGDENITICFYKCLITVVMKLAENDYRTETIFLANRFTWSKFSDWIGNSELTIKHKNGYYVLYWTYNKIHYKVYFGYGVDIGSYEKWHIVNYYRSLHYKFYNMLNEIKFKIMEWRIKNE